MASATVSVSNLSEQFRNALDMALTEADADERLGPLLRATQLRLRFEFTDTGLELNVAAGEGGRNLRWAFGGADWPARLELAMATPIANRFLQGSESIAIAIARGEVRLSGGSRVALRYLPATRLLAGPYRRVVERDFPELLVA
jgi:hypothetical protein